MNNLAIIPARSGSKGLRDKNILPLAGIPLLAYTIRAAKASGAFSEIMVSTDSDRYAQVALQYGAEVPFLRSAETAGDAASTWAVVREVLEKYRAMGLEFDTAALLQPTSPLRTGEDIRAAYALYHEKDADAVVSVTLTSHPVQWCFGLDESRYMDEFGRSGQYKKRRQELPARYQLNGAIYIVQPKRLQDPQYELYRNNCYAYLMPPERACDIDSALDFAICEAVLKMENEAEREHGYGE